MTGWGLLRIALPGLLLLLCCAGAVTAADSTPEEYGAITRIEQRLELDRHALLLNVIHRPGVELNEFTTDGCSGGMSAGWQLLAKKMPAFATDYGSHPPWEACCTTHDRSYHRGGRGADSPEQSFESRRQADLELRSCIIATGQANAPAQSRKFLLGEAEILRLYTLAADLMYRAVRIGGMPCTGLPWRWGYGWPECEQPSPAR